MYFVYEYIISYTNTILIDLWTLKLHLETGCKHTIKHHHDTTVSISRLILPLLPTRTWRETGQGRTAYRLSDLHKSPKGSPTKNIPCAVSATGPWMRRIQLPFFGIVKLNMISSYPVWNGLAPYANRGTPKSSILIGFPHPFWGTPIFGNNQIDWNLTECHICPNNRLSTAEKNLGSTRSARSPCSASGNSTRRMPLHCLGDGEKKLKPV